MLPQIAIPKVNTGAFRFGENARAAIVGNLWKPNEDVGNRPNPQRLALESEADEVFYGGSAGCGKTDLLIGCPTNGHRKSVIFRRTSPNLAGVINRSKEIIGEDDYNEVQKKHKLGDGKFIEFGYMQYDKNKSNWQGRDHDFYGFDEITEFTKSQYSFVIGWNRSTIPGQRCRVICVGNPPIDQDGAWVIEEWGPWLDDVHPMPQKYGDLMWYTYDDNGRLQWSYTALDGWSSRTFIPGTLADNPHLAEDGRYLARLNSMPEPLRSAFRDGDFKILSRQGNPFQVIPLAWIRAAQRRWQETEEPGGDWDTVGHDVSRGGQDKTTSIGRKGEYFKILGVWPGVAIQDGPTAAAHVHESLEGKEADVINVDVIGYGAASYDSLVGMGHNAQPVNVSTASTYKDKSGKMRCKDLRTELVWRMRDALDPDNNSMICLPDDPELASDLCVYTYKALAGGVVTIKSKDDMKKEIGRSPDIGDGLLLANYNVVDFWVW